MDAKGRDAEPETGLTMPQLDALVDEAQDALLAAAAEAPEEWWEPDDLRRRAQNGAGGDVMMFALTDLVNRGNFELDRSLRVKLVRRG